MCRMAVGCWLRAGGCWRLLFAGCLGLEEGFGGVAEGDVGVDDVELPSVPDDLIDT